MKSRKYRHVVAAVFDQPWAILPSKLQEIGNLIALRSEGIKLSKEDIQARIGAPRRINQPQMQSGPSRVAVLDLFGTISQRVSMMSDISGGTSAEAFGQAFDRAIADDSVSAIVINADTPGGSISGIQELSQKIYAARGKKPVITVANTMLASAGYWIGSAADQIVATPSANSIGSIGVITLHTDDSEAEAKAGLKTTVIASTEFKAEGYGPLSDAAKEFIRDKVMGTYDTFVGDVARNRGVSKATVLSSYGQGRSLSAKDALAAGMVDRIATLEQVLSELGVSGGSAATMAAVENPITVSKEVPPMDPKLKTKLIRIGACECDTPDNEAMARLHGWMAAKGLPALSADATTDVILKSLEGKIDVPPVEAVAAAPVNVTVTTGQQQTVAGTPVIAPKGGDGVPHKEMVACVRLAGGLSADDRLELIEALGPQCNSLTLSAINQKIAEKLAEKKVSQPTGATTITSGAAEYDKFHAEARDAILIRAWQNDLPEQIWSVSQRDNVDWKPNRKRAHTYGSLPVLAERCLMASGVSRDDIDSLAKADIARIIMGSNPRDFGLRADDGGMLYNVSGMFTNLLVDAAHVLLRRSYGEAKTTFQDWMKQGQSLTDFRPVHKVIAGELPDPKAIPEDGEFEESSLVDSQEQYKLTVWGEKFSITWQTIVNDQLNSFSEIPMKQGRAMRRKQNKLAYGILLDNAKLGADGIALFDSNSLATPGHNNLTTGAAVPSVATFNAMYTKMAQMTGLNTAANTVLNLEPKYVIGPPALRGSIEQILTSTSDPQAGGTNAGNANSNNIWRNRLMPIIDAQLSAAVGGSDTAWYFAADTADVDTIEYAYLQGLETPALEQSSDWNRLGVQFRIYQAFAVKALDYRGLQKNAGA